MSFAQNLEQLMKESKMSNYRLAKLAKVSQTTIANWVNGRTVPYEKDRERIAEIFGVTVEELMGADIMRKRKYPLALLGEGDIPPEFIYLYSNLSEISRMELEKYARFLLTQQGEK